MRFIVDTESWSIAHEGAQPLSWFDQGGFDLLSSWWLQASWQRQYSYQFQWLGRPIIQQPADIVMMQDLIYRIKPTVIIETGIAHGGSLIFSASMLHLLHGGSAIKPRVIGIDIEIRPHNRAALQAHPLNHLLELIETSSIDETIVADIERRLGPNEIVMVVLDSNHTHAHVRRELELYAPLVSVGSALVVMDGIIPALAHLPRGDRSWTADNPQAAIDDFRQTSLGREFVVEDRYDQFKLTHSPGGILLRRGLHAAS